MNPAGEAFTATLHRERRARDAAYRVLNLEPGADPESLKRAYRRAAKQHHPDLHAGDPDAHQRFLLVTCAFELLEKGKPCDQLAAAMVSWSDHGIPQTVRARFRDSRDYFLWWQEMYF